MARFFYNLLWPLGFVLFLPGALRKMVRRGGYRKSFGQRFGAYSAETRAALHGKRPTWIHAVSVGEIMIALKIANELRALRPELEVVLTTTTTTGHALATRTVPKWITVFYSPLDFWPVMRRAFRVIVPERIVLIEAEVWPNMLARAKARGMPVILANARLSLRSEKRFRLFRAIVAPLFSRLDLICVPDESDAARWRALGGEKISVVGNVKYDLTGLAPLPPPEIGDLTKSLVLLGASTHAGEEEMLARVYQKLRPEFPALHLVVVPRHAERAASIMRDLRALGLEVTRRTERTLGDCLIVDTTGELRSWLEIATVVFVGKSLTAHGGQNPIEAVAAGKPVLFGPNMENFAQISAQLVEVGAALIVRAEAELEDGVRRLLADKDERSAMVARARDVLMPHQGAAARTALAIEQTNRLQPAI